MIDILALPTLADRDRIIEDFWSRLEDVPMNPETECIEEAIDGFPAGTPRLDIWKAVDQRYSKGVAALLYGDGVDRTTELGALTVRNLLCEECEADCVYSPEGICRFPLVYGRKPNLSEEGCDDCIPTYLSGL